MTVVTSNESDHSVIVNVYAGAEARRGDIVNKTNRKQTCASAELRTA